MGSKMGMYLAPYGVHLNGIHIQKVQALSKMLSALEARAEVPRDLLSAGQGLVPVLQPKQSGRDVDRQDGLSLFGGHASRYCVESVSVLAGRQ